MYLKKLHPSPAQKTVTVNLPTGEVYGMNVTDLQEEIQVKGDKVSGTLKYVKNFDKFEKGAEGNFLAIEVEEAKNGDTVSFELSDPEKKGTGTLNSKDYLLVSKIHSNSQTITLRNGETTKVLNLTGLTLNEVE